MFAIKALLVVLAIVFFILAWLKVGREKFNFEWLAFACLTAAYLVGKG